MPDLVGYIATGVISLSVGLLLRSFEPRVRLVFWSPHNFRFQLKDPEIVIQTDSITVQNLGRKPAEDVEIIHKAKPDFFRLSPALPYDDGVLDTGEYFIRIPTLGRKEFFTLQVLSYKTLPSILYVRSKAGPGRLVDIRLQIRLPKWVQVLGTAILLAGLGTVLYWLVLLGILIARSMPASHAAT